MGYQQIKLLRTRGQVLSWINRLKDVLTDLLSADDRSRSAPIEKARQYVLDHVEEQINLQDVADYVFLSPNYLSSLFKKQYGQSFISYINQVKVNRACELIRERKLLIGEIAFQLVYENATPVCLQANGKRKTASKSQNGRPTSPLDSRMILK